MPTNRRRREHRAQALGPLETEHLETGSDHLLAGDCWICARGVETARGHWHAARAAILARWPHPFPTFAAIVFDRAPLPDVDPTRDRDRLIWKLIESSLAVAKSRDA